ncbi:MAG: type II secretion system protein GspL [Gammaproteobacteria bacterium]
MADTLLLHFNPAHNAASWALVNESGELTSMLTQGELSQATALASSHRCVVLLDNTLVHINSVQLPVSNRQKLLRAIPYALEDQLADDVEEFHFVAGKADSNNGTPVAGIRRETLQSVLDTLAAHAIKPDAVLPDALCLAGTTQQWAILLNKNVADIQISAFNGAEYDRELAPLIIETSLRNVTLPTPEKILLFCTEEDNPEDIRKVIPDDIELVQIKYNQHPLVVYCGQYKNAMPLNLLQGDFKPKSKTTVQWKRWRLAASLAAFWLVLNLSVTAYQYQQLDASNNEMQAEIIKLYKSSFPESRKIVNPRVQMEQKLNELKTGVSGEAGSLLGILADATSALSKDTNITLQSIDYRNNRVDINLTSNNLGAIQTLNNNLNQVSTLKSEIISSTSDKNAVKGSLRLQKAGT